MTRLLLLGLLAFGVNVSGAEMRHRIYAHPMNPREHPDDDRRAVRPPDWKTFGDRVHFTALRGFEIKDDRLVGVREEIDRYTRKFDLGDVVWPAYPVLFTKNVGELADEIRERKLYLFDIWGYVPGSGPGGYWQQFHPPAGVFDMLESKLGERWLGMDVGEQDGRYLGGYANQMYPATAGRFEQYLNFHRHFERMTGELGNKMSTLVSLNFGHYFLKEGIYTLIGAETAQGLPNSQVYYAWIRGAGKQYGVPWFGNASVWNRWGYKSYGETKDDHGPTKGTSLSLLKRLLYSQILYDSMLVGFEAGWIEGDQLTPIGRIQQAANRWTREHGRPGTMLTPIAVMTDFFAGWTFPRHLYTSHVYRVWGNLPYGAGDYLTDGVLDMLYPGYQDSSYFHDESGFQTATPYGDSADVLLSDAPGWVMERYPALAITGELSGGAEVREKLQHYAETGGRLFVTSGNVAKLPGGVCGVEAGGPPIAVSLPGERFDVLDLKLPGAARVLARGAGRTLAAEVGCGKGGVTVFASRFGVPRESVLQEPVKSEEDKPLAKPYPLLRHVREVLDRAFRDQTLFEAGEGLSLIVCRKAAGDYTLGVANNSWRERPFRIVSRCGPIEQVNELVLDQSEKGAPGYLPEVVPAATGTSREGVIAGGDVRIFSVRVREEGIEEIPHTPPSARPRQRGIVLAGGRSLQEEILAMPTFFEHFDTATADWRYVRDREPAALAREAGWIRRQGLRIIVDLTSGLNLYPDLRLVENDETEYRASMATIEEIMTKMPALGSRDLILSLHRTPENNFTEEQTQASFESTLKRLAAFGEARGITLHLRLTAAKPPRDVRTAVQFLERVGARNVRIAPRAEEAAGVPSERAGLCFATEGRKPAEVPAGVTVVFEGSGF